MRGVLAGCVVASLLVLAPAPAPAQATPGDDIVALCQGTIADLPEVGRRICHSDAALLALLGASCRRLPGTLPADCATVDGHEVNEAQIAEYEASWAHRALDLQRTLDDGEPLLRALVPHTHNSFNAPVYPANVSGLDPNQLYSVRDQLRMDVRGIELDVHWVLDPATGEMAAVLCHGESAEGIHLGCAIDRPLATGLAEIRSWLAESANADEVVVLYLENNLDGEPAAHEAAAAAIDAELGSLVLRPPSDEPCADMPLALSRAAIRATGARVLIVGNCGPGAWGAWVHERGPQWDESGSDPGDDYPSDCDAERAAVGYDTHWIRRYEDSTWLSAMAGGGGQVTLEETGRMVRCGVNMPGFDQLHPDDARLAALVWSWAPDEPAAGAAGCVFSSGDARFHVGGCASVRPVACRNASGEWMVTRPRPWAKAAKACRKIGATRSTPVNGWDNELLRRAAAAAGATEVWLGLTFPR